MTTLHLAERSAAGRLLGSRYGALPIRDEIVALLEQHDKVALDFAGTNPTQSFVDEIIGVLVVERGPSVLKHLVFLNCNEDVKAILHFVVGDRLSEYNAESSSAMH
ncbi:STAS-like domain-containing protein [Ralstonia solanacearum]|uniref:STAS-like domain-containing protein n=1 Tax=Ralstonia solanacearum TaxID=305 RepID=UPI003CC5AFC5